MQEQARERWMQLAEMAASEQDPEKLVELTKEIVRLLGEKQDRLDRPQPISSLQNKNPKPAIGPFPLSFTNLSLPCGPA